MSPIRSRSTPAHLGRLAACSLAVAVFAGTAARAQVAPSPAPAMTSGYRLWQPAPRTVYRYPAQTYRYYYVPARPTYRYQVPNRRYRFYMAAPAYVPAQPPYRAPRRGGVQRWMPPML